MEEEAVCLKPFSMLETNKGNRKSKHPWPKKSKTTKGSSPSGLEGKGLEVTSHLYSS